jgi:hypothetical protein
MFGWFKNDFELLKKSQLIFSKGKMVKHIVSKDEIPIDLEKFDKTNSFKKCS